MTSLHTLPQPGYPPMPAYQSSHPSRRATQKEILRSSRRVALPKKAKDPRFVERPIKSLKFVDDGVNVDKVNMRKLRLLVEGNKPVREIRAQRIQELLE